ncbi:MAG TPA: acyl-CoA dehydrogenase family protein, partial [Burkholderiaceae bacterium]|nr:acyl-CoA dehydrogenase family protein [Burkholderiaceae bacterium]
MNFDTGDEQRALHESLARWLDKHYTFAQRRERLTAAGAIDEATWHTFAEMGLLALPLPEDHGGLGGGSVDVAGVMGLLGAKLVLEPYLPTVLAAMLLADTGTPAQCERWLPEVAQGRLRLAFAHGEPGSRHARTRVTASARRDGEHWRLDGHKAVVIGAPQAHALLVSTRVSGTIDAADGLALFVVDASAPGVELRSYRNHDGQHAADVMLRQVSVPDAQQLAAAGAAGPAIDRALDRGAALVCAEALGILRAMNDTTLEYLKTRKQFGVAIGTFQALQHRMADMVVATEQASSMALLAAVKADSHNAAERVH